MSGRSVILIGGPDSGKTNFIGRLWPALDSGKCRLVAKTQPTDIGFVLDTAEHLFQGHFAPRSEHVDDRRDFEIDVGLTSDDKRTKIVIPDISGELWRSAVINSELAEEWMKELRQADGALLFVRVQSDQDVRPLDWVTSKGLLSRLGQDEERGKLPTQVMLCELIRHLELMLSNRPDSGRPRLSVIVSAWDLVDEDTYKAGPIAYLGNEYPLLAGRLQHVTRLDVRVFGLSVVGGDLKYDEKYRDAFLDKPFDDHGWVVTKNGESGLWKLEPDVTLPVAWVVGS